MPHCRKSHIVAHFFYNKACVSLKLKKALTIMKRLKDYIRSQIQKHRETFDQDDIRDFVDLYLRSHETSGNKHITGTYEEHKTFFPFINVYQALA